MPGGDVIQPSSIQQLASGRRIKETMINTVGEWIYKLLKGNSHFHFYFSLKFLSIFNGNPGSLSAKTFALGIYHFSLTCFAVLVPVVSIPLASLALASPRFSRVSRQQKAGTRQLEWFSGNLISCRFTHLQEATCCELESWCWNLSDSWRSFLFFLSWKWLIKGFQPCKTG